MFYRSRSKLPDIIERIGRQIGPSLTQIVSVANKKSSSLVSRLLSYVPFNLQWEYLEEDRDVKFYILVVFTNSKTTLVAGKPITPGKEAVTETKTATQTDSFVPRCCPKRLTF